MNQLKVEEGRDRVKFLPHADMRGVPFFLKGVVKGKFPKGEEKWVLLDWKGRIAQAYHYQSDASNILVFDEDGSLAYQTHGREPEDSKLESIVEKLKALMSRQKEKPETLRGFTPKASSWEREYEAKLKEQLSPKRAEEHLRWLTSRPHLAGSEGTRITVEYIHEQMEKYGFETETVRYDAYLPAPVSVFIELVEPIQEVIPTTEDRIDGDEFTQNVGEHPGWNGYSPSGEATGQVVYAHFGSGRNLRTLVEMGVDLRGKILLMRYFGTGEGRKVHNAQQFGAAGVVLYVDPAQDGYRFGDVYPKGNWRPPGAIMRRSIEFLPYSGDPLSPGWASVSGAKRLALEDVYMPGIPVLPITYRSAEKILKLLGGPETPLE